MTYSLGVDLGTTFTAAAVARQGRVELLRLGAREAVIPSAVFVKDDGDVLFGEVALRRGREDPTRLAREFKRRVGDPAPMLLGDQEYPAEQLMGMLLRHVVDKATEVEGQPPGALVVTHPANWGGYKRTVLERAVESADVGMASFLTEPEAAAIAYTARGRIDVDDVVAVYDLGGGTFDVALLRRSASGFDIVGEPHGVEQMGGIDFDYAVAAFAVSEAGLDPDDLAGDSTGERLQAAAISAESEAAKIALSSDTETVVDVVVDGTSYAVRLSRVQFEQMIRPSIATSIGALERTLAAAGLTADDVGQVLLVGGSSRIPAIAGALTEAFGRPIAVDADPKAAICTGAALSTDIGRPSVESPPPAAVAPVVAPVVVPPVMLPAETETSVFAAPVATPTPGPPPHEPTAPVVPASAGAEPPKGDDEVRRRRLLIGGAALAVLLLGVALFAVFGGSGGDTRASDETTSTSEQESTTSSTEATTTSTAPSTSSSTSTSEAPPETAAAVLGRTDFANKTYDVDCFGETNRITLVDGGGFGGEFGDLGVGLIEAFPDDFDGDGDGEVVVLLGCSIGANGSEVDAMIFEAENGSAVRQGSLLVAFKGNITRDGREFVQTTPVVKDDEPLCCPSELREERFRVAVAPFGSFFESVSVQTIPNDPG